MSDNADFIAELDGKNETMDFILRNTTPEDKRSLPPRFHTYIVLAEDDDGRRQVATIQHSYRPKNAGGSAWQALIDEAAIPGRSPSGSTGVAVYSKTIKQLCEIVRYVITREGEAPSHWR